MFSHQRPLEPTGMLDSTDIFPLTSWALGFLPTSTEVHWSAAKLPNEDIMH